MNRKMSFECGKRMVVVLVLALNAMQAQTPMITSVSPDPVTAWDYPQPFYINGANFVSGCKVTLRDLSAGQSYPNRTIKDFSGTQVLIEPNFTSAVHNWSVEVINPDGQSSGPYNFSVQAPTRTITFSFPLTYNNWTPYTAEIVTVFDHAMPNGRYQPGGGVVSYTDERGTVPDPNEYVNFNGVYLYSFKKVDGGPFLINGHYVGTTTTGSTTLNYDGHPGYDYPVPDNTDVFAAAEGSIVIVDAVGSTCSGKYVRVQHGISGYQSQYLHLSQVLVSVGAQVSRAQLIGRSGHTGCVSGPHLHFEVKLGVGESAVSVDPYGWQPLAGSAPDPYTAEINKNLWLPPSSLPTISTRFTTDFGVPGMFHQSALLPSNKVLIFGGGTNDAIGCGIPSKVAKEFDIITETLTPVASTSIGREDATTVVLDNGKALTLGSGEGCTTSSSAKQSELYDPVRKTWSNGAVSTNGFGHTLNPAPRLPNGKILFTGGYWAGNSWAYSELYNQTTGKFEPAGSMSINRYVYAGGVLDNGKFLITGGGSGCCGQGEQPFQKSAELFDPATNMWTPTGDMNVARGFGASSLQGIKLNDGKFLVVGGYNYPQPGFYKTSELYDPASGTWTYTKGDLNFNRGGARLFLLTTGHVLIVGGAYDDAGNLVKAIEAYDPVSQEFSVVGQLQVARRNFNAIKMQNGNILVVGGLDDKVNFLSSMEIITVQPSRAPTAASVTQPVAGPGLISFNQPGNQTSVSINFLSLGGSGSVMVNLLPESPTDLAFSTNPPANVSQYRWVISQSGLTSVSAEVRFDLSQFSTGIINPTTVTVYSRPIAGSGQFVFLPTTYNVSSNELRAAVSEFSEFIFGSNYDPLTIVAEKGQLPNTFYLFQNYPNPFNPSTTINFTLPKSTFVTLRVYDVLGRQVGELVNEKLGPGTYTRQWYARDLASGVYFYRLSAGDFVQTKKLILVR